MNKSALRNFAVWARRDLIKRISDRANLLGIYENKPSKDIQATTEKGFIVNGVTFEFSKEMRTAFIKRVSELGFQDAIEEIAYTWFNRIVALRFMEVNGYLTNGKNGEKIYIIGSTIANKNEPDALTNADKLSFVDKLKVYDYQDANDNNGLYRYILTKQCNDLNNVMPQMFERINDYAELLLPDHLLDKGSIIDRLVNDIKAEDFNILGTGENGEKQSQVEIVGWLYQFYISEKKDEVFANKDKITKGTLPAVTQLFTPDWIVKYMTENSLGKMWVDGHKNSKLKNDMKYFVEEAEQTEEVSKKLAEINKEYANKDIREITFIDPCCGSGHILVYAFDLFYKMYLECGYSQTDIPSLILQNNLIGIDVDKRAVQLTSFALTMKALSYDKSFLLKGIYPSVIDIKESNSINQAELKDFIRIGKFNNADEEMILNTVEKFKDAELFGSLIKDFNYTTGQYDILLKYIQYNVNAELLPNFIDRQCVYNLKPLICDLLKQAIILSLKYDIMATNPPYLSPSTNDKLKEFANAFYPDSKTDMFAMFMEVPLVKKNGLLAMINMHSWMFLVSYNKLRPKILNKNLLSMCHLGPRAFEDIGGEVVSTTSFVIRECSCDNYNASYFRLVDKYSQREKETSFMERTNKYVCSSSNFYNIPEQPIAYWASLSIIKAFKQYPNINNISEAKQGMIPGNVNIFVKLWFEVYLNKIGFNHTHNSDIIKNKKRWFPYNKGGSFRKWFGNYEHIIDMENDGYRIKYSGENNNYRLRDPELYFKTAVTWSKVSSGIFSARYMPKGYLFDIAGCCIFNLKEKEDYALAFLNSIVAKNILGYISPTLNYEVEHIKKIPINFKEEQKEKINQITKSNIEIAKTDWDQYETSWDFGKSPLI